MGEYQALSNLRRVDVDIEKIQKITQKICDAGKFGTFLVDDMSFRELTALSQKIEEPVFYIYPVNDNQVALEIKSAGATSGDSEMLKILVGELCKVGAIEKADTRNFDMIGNTAAVIAILLQQNSRLKRNYPILVNEELMNRPYYTESGELVQLSSNDFDNRNRGLSVQIQNKDIDIQRLDVNTTRQYIEQASIIQIVTTLTTKRFKESGFSYTYLDIYYLGQKCKIAKNRGKCLARILMEHNGKPVKNNELASELLKCGISISMNDAKDGWRMESSNFSRQLSAAKSEANSGIRKVIKERCNKNAGTLDFVKTMAGKNRHYFDNNGF